MTTYTHHITGRLRTRYSQLKNNPALAKITEDAIRKVRGVISVEASIVTGSLLIRYDAHAAKSEGLLDTLYQTKQRLGLIPAPQRAPLPMKPEQSAIADTLTEKLLGMAVEKCIERSTIAFLAALL